jgi:protein O-mannosyl-transferase
MAHSSDRMASTWGQATLPHSRAIIYAGLLLVVALAYVRSLDDPFHFDDIHSIVDNTNLRDLSQIPRYFVDPGAFSSDSTLTMYRPLLLTTYAANHALSGSSPWSHHLGNVAIHGAVVIAVLELLLLLLGHSGAALLGALLFGLHPAHSETVYYVSSRSESLAALFVLLALILHIRSACDGRGRTAGHLATVGAFVAGLLTKSTAIVFLPLALLVDILARPGMWRRRWQAHVSHAVVAAAYLIYTRDLLAKATLSAPVRSFTEQFWSQLKGVVYYLQLLALPRDLTVDHQFQLSSGPDTYAASALLFLGSALFMCFMWRSSRPMVVLLAAWFLLALAPASMVPLNVIINEHRIYLSGVAFAAGGAWLTAHPLVPGSRTARRGLFWVVPVFGVLALLRGSSWNSTESLWLDALHKAPDMARPRFIIGESWLRQGRAGESAKMLAAGLERDPAFVAGYRLLAEAHMAMGDGKAAMVAAQRGTGLHAQVGDGWVLQAEVARYNALTVSGADRMLWFEHSAAAYEEALRIEPDEAAHHDNLGNTLQELQRPAEALKHHLRAVQLTPRSAASWLNLGNVQWALGRQQESETAYLRALDVDPLYELAWSNLAALYDQAGATELAANARSRARAARDRASQ